MVTNMVIELKNDNMIIDKIKVKSSKVILNEIENLLLKYIRISEIAIKENREKYGYIFEG